VSAHDEFYVGYLPLGEKQKRIVRMLVPAIGFALLAVASLLAMSTDPTGRGLWDVADTETIEGILRVEPYAEVVTEDGAVIIVDAGKVGARDGIEQFAGRRVRAEGYPLTRDGMRMLELLPGDEGLGVLDERASPAHVMPTGEPIEIVGEILDLKCYLGAMKPGAGITHRGCAALCVRGGVPPAVTDESGEVYVIVGEAWEAMNDRVLDLVGVRARIEGFTATRDGVRYLRDRKSVV